MATTLETLSTMTGPEQGTLVRGDIARHVEWSMRAPSCPFSFEPQQVTVPSAKSAQAWKGPEAMAVAADARGTRTGLREHDTVFVEMLGSTYGHASTFA